MSHRSTTFGTKLPSAVGTKYETGWMYSVALATSTVKSLSFLFVVLALGPACIRRMREASITDGVGVGSTPLQFFGLDV